MPSSILNSFSAALLAVVCASSAVHAQSVDAIAVIHLDSFPMAGSLLTAHARVRGHEGHFAFDTGEGVTMITPEFAHAIGCVPWGQITGFQMSGSRIDSPRCDGLTFDMGGQHLSAQSVMVFDLTSHMPPNLPRLDGSLGFDLFAGRRITFQLNRRTIVIESPSSFARRLARATEVPIRIVRDAEGLALTVDVGVPTAEGMAWMELDSGGGTSFIIGKHIAALFKLDPESKAMQSVNFTLAGKIPVTAPARVMDQMIMDGNINVPFLRNWDVALDLANGRAWVAPAVSR